MINLRTLEGKKVRILAINGEVFEGTVSDYIFPEDNEPEGVEGIAVEDCPQRPGQWLGFNEPDIVSIEVIG